MNYFNIPLMLHVWLIMIPVDDGYECSQRVAAYDTLTDTIWVEISF